MFKSEFHDIIIVLASFALTLGLTVWMRGLLLKRAVLDLPNERSSHKAPVPRGGGWALLMVLIPGMIAASMAQHDMTRHAGLIAGTIVLALVSWLDDRKGASVHTRLSLHLMAACLGSLSFPPQDLIFGGVLPFAVDRMLMIAGWVWFINLYNFMDGIDGITCAETVAIASGAGFLITVTGHPDAFASALTLLLTGASLGFLALNWHPAKIFLGDVGSVPLGYLTGFILIVLAVNGHPIPALILPLYYLADSGITLVKRIMRREKIWQAHRQHFYQRAAQVLGRHDKVVYRMTAANIALIAAAFIAVTNPWAGLAAGAAIVAILIGTLHKRRPVLPSR